MATNYLVILLILLSLVGSVQAAEVAPDLAHRPLVVVIPSDFPPTYFKDPVTGKPAGLAVDVLNELARRADLQITYRFAKPWQEIEELLLQGKADLIPFRVINDKTAQQFIFTDNLGSSTMNYVVRSINKTAVAPVAGQKIGIIRGSTAEEFLKRRTDLVLLPSDSMDHLLMDLISGQVDMVLTAGPNLLQLAEKLRLGERLRVLEPPAQELKRGIALRKGNEELRDRLNKAIDDFHHSKAALHIYEKWLGKPVPYWTVKRLVWLFSGLLVLIVTLLVSWYTLRLRRTNRRLAAERSLLQTMIDAIPDLIFYKDRQSVYLGCNRSFSELFVGRPREQIVGYRDSDFVPDPELAASFRAKDQEVMAAADGPQKIDEWIPFADGSSVLVETVKVPFLGDEGCVGGLIGISRDVTERDKTLRQLDQARKAAEAASRAKSQFLANMSHELRTPMNGVMGMAQLLEMTSLDAEQREYLANIIESGNKHLAILDDILELARIEDGQTQQLQRVFSLASLLEEVSSDHRKSCSAKGLTLQTTISPLLPRTMVGDMIHIRQILYQLLSNAVKFTRQGGITISCYVLNSLSDRAIIAIDLSDTGIGIKPEDLKRIFTPFEQVDNSNTRLYGGTGLGLAICQRLTAAIGGSITVTSSPDEGSTFHLTFPVGLAAPGTDVPGEPEWN